jgi:hypothetical protein
MGIEVRYSPIRHPEINPTDRVMRKFGNFFQIYCNETHEKWPEQVYHIEKWLNSSVSETMRYAPIEMLGVYGEKKFDLFKQILKKEPDQQQMKMICQLNR